MTTQTGERLSKGNREFLPESLNFEPLEEFISTLRHGNSELNVGLILDRADFCVADKPSGVPTHPLSLFDTRTLTHWAFYRFPELKKEFDTIQPTVTPHRLDTGTSGIVLVAKTQAAFATWRERFRRKEIQKEYLAWCWGAPQKERYEVANTVGHDSRDIRKMKEGREGDAGIRSPCLRAKSTVEVVQTGKGRFLAKVTCLTGVTHQVRVHCAGLGFPLLGDALYDRDYALRTEKISPHELRAVRLSGEGFDFTAPATTFRKKY